MDDYLAFWQRLGRIVVRLGWRVYAVALMPNHVHLVVKTPAGNLSAGMQAVLPWYARRVNRHLNMTGHLFQGRFGYRLCQRDTYLLQLVRYVHLNPLKAGLVRDVAGWSWTSHLEYIGKRQTAWIDTASVLAQFGMGPATRESYLQFLGDHPADDVFDRQLDRQPVLGTDEFITESKELWDLPVRGEERPGLAGYSLERLAQLVAEMHGVALTDIRAPGKFRQASHARRDFAFLSVRHAHHSVTSVAAYLGRSLGSVSQALRRVDAPVSGERGAQEILEQFLTAAKSKI